MKLRISSFKTALRKDITRFAPAWVLYLVGMLLLMLSVINSAGRNRAAATLEETLAFMGVINALYAGVCAQLLFGDLFQSRLCNALHAMPVRREDWFFSHVVAGLSFSLVPNTICAWCLMPALGENSFVAFLWLAAVTMQYLFFFGLGALSALCSGNRVAMTAVYGILNFASLLVLWFVDTIYSPMLYGVIIPTEKFFVFSPIVQLCMNLEFFRFSVPNSWAVTGLGEDWWYLLVIAGLGLVMLVLALLLYRRRKLEYAGDFLAVKPLEPVFSVVYTLAAVVVFSLVGELFDVPLVFTATGFLVGFFTGQMLLQRTVRIFSWKLFAKLAVFGALMLGSIGLTALDPLGIVSFVPEREEIQSVYLYDGVATDDKVSWLELTEEADIALIREVHQDRIDKRTGSGGYYAYVTIRYQLKDGSTVKRCYRGPTESVRKLFSRPEHVLGADSMDALLEKWTTIRIEGKELKEADREALLNAVFTDCVLGNMAQDWDFHNQYSSVKVWLELESGKEKYLELRIFEDAKNTMWWLIDNYDAWGPEGVAMEDILGLK